MLDLDYLRKIIIDKVKTDPILRSINVFEEFMGNEDIIKNYASSIGANIPLDENPYDFFYQTLYNYAQIINKKNQKDLNKIMIPRQSEYLSVLKKYKLDTDINEDERLKILLNSMIK